MPCSRLATWPRPRFRHAGRHAPRRAPGKKQLRVKLNGPSDSIELCWSAELCVEVRLALGVNSYETNVRTATLAAIKLWGLEHLSTG